MSMPRPRRARDDAIRILQLLSGSLYDDGIDENDVIMEYRSVRDESSGEEAEGEFTPDEDEDAEEDEEDDDVEVVTDEPGTASDTERPSTEDEAPSTSSGAARSGSDIAGPSSAPGTSAMDVSLGNTSFDEGTTCSICFDNYTSDGEHRVVCIACGHLFGKSCIERWLQCSATRGAGKCPKCKARAKKKDVRPLFAKLVQMTDTSDLEKARIELNNMKKEKEQLALQLAKVKHEHQIELMRVKNEAGVLRKREGSLLSNQSPVKKSFNYISLSLTQRGYPLVVCEKRTSRVFASAPGMCLAAATCEFSYQNRILPPFGVEMVNLNFGNKTGKSAKIHMAPIRDVKFSPADERGKSTYLLTASMDKTIALTNVESLVRVLKLTVGVACWSCAFNNQSPHFVFAGAGNGTINLYDTRRPTSAHEAGERSEVVSEITGGVFGPPFFAMQWIDCAEESVQNSSGLLVASGRKCIFFESLTETVFKPHVLFEGPLSSLAYCQASKAVLLTVRPTSDTTHVRHLMSQFSYRNLSDDPEKVISNYSLNTIQEIRGGSLAKNLSRNAIFANPFQEDQILAAIFDEQSKKISVWRGAEGEEEVAIDSPAPEIMQVECVSVGTRSILLALDNHKLRIYDLKTP